MPVARSLCLFLAALLSVGPMVIAVRAEAPNPMADLEAAIARTRQRATNVARQSAEQCIDAADRALQPRAEGFARLYQARLEARRDRLRALLDGEPGVQSLRDGTDALNHAIRRYQLIGEAPAARPMRITGMQAAVSVPEALPWAQGLQMNVRVGDTGLRLHQDAALRLRGQNAYVETPLLTNQLPENDTVTFACWVRPQRTGAGTIIEGNQRGGNWRWDIVQNGSGVSFMNHGSDSNHTSSPSGSAPPGEWTHVAVTYDKNKTSAQVFINGNLTARTDKQSPYTLRAAHDKPLRLGGKTSRQSNNALALRDVSIWRGVLTAQQIQSIMYDEPTGDEEDLIACWPLDEGEADTAHEKSAGAHHGRVVRGEWVPRVSDGFWLSRPITFVDINTPQRSHITWQAHPEGTGHVTVYTGASSSAETLPDRWQRAQNGKPIPSLDGVDDLSRQYLWIKQKLTRRGHPTGPEVRRLRVTVTGE